jgi:non-ribosomal peptide synthetase component E (peptide arylation enzyme)
MFFIKKRRKLMSKTIVSEFRRTARKFPHNIAVEQEKERLDYSALDELSDRLAFKLGEEKTIVLKMTTACISLNLNGKINKEQLPMPMKQVSIG